MKFSFIITPICLPWFSNEDYPCIWHGARSNSLCLVTWWMSLEVVLADDFFLIVQVLIKWFLVVVLVLYVCVFGGIVRCLLHIRWGYAYWLICIWNCNVILAYYIASILQLCVILHHKMRVCLKWNLVFRWNKLASC